MTTPIFLEQAFNGVQLGMILFLMAVGVTLVFGIMDTINLSHGSLLMFGAYFIVEAVARTGSYGLGLVLALFASALLSVLVEIAVMRPLYRRGHLDQVLATFGLILFFNELAVMIWGRGPHYLDIPEFLNGQVDLMGLPYPAYRFAVTAVAVAVGVGLYFLITRTRTGMLIRAGADKRVVVEMMGVNIARLYTLIFALGGVLAGLAGIMMVPLISVQPAIGDPILITTLVVVIIGGIGSIRGALVGGLLVGVLDTFGRILFPLYFGTGTGSALANMTIYILMAAVLLWRPKGLFPATAG
ncbi:MAG TPA: branched-chain amino acid ABC transporter permease [Alphaproteobacteria bacterium]|jgi:branched-chain amino acid transport system permease protein